MTATMNKEDVKLEYTPLSKVKWAEVQQTAGKAVPALAKTTVEEVLEGVASKKYKKPYGKVGLIKKDLWFRIKDGSTHIDDILLVKNWKEPSGGDQELTKEQEKGLKTWIDGRKLLLKICEDGLKDAKPHFKTVEDGCEKISIYLDLAKQGSTGTITGTGIEANADKAKNLVKEVQDALADMKQVHDRDVFPTYDHYRNKDKTPDKSLNIPEALYDEYAAGFYLLTVGPVYKALSELIKKAESMLETAKKQYLLIVRWSSEASSALDNYKEEAQGVLDEMTEEFVKIKAEEGMSPFSNLENGLKTDTDNLSTYQSDLLDRLLDNATGKITKAKETMKRILGRMKTVEQQVNKLKAFPKPMQSNKDVKPTIVNALTLYKNIGVYVKQQQAYLIKGDKQFQKFRSEFNKKAV